MNQLLIRLTGEIQSSNFPEWKNELIQHIESVDIELSTDDDFIEAIRHVKLFKAAEEYLRNAKQSALDQSLDIQRLFAAIDEVSERARQTRLALERQINLRKRAIRADCIQAGIETIRFFIQQQNADFQSLDHGIFLDRDRFDLAAKRKGGVKGLQVAIESLCEELKSEIRQKARECNVNASTIDSLPSKYRLLFQDRSSLISLDRQELTLVIENRIGLFDAEGAKDSVEDSVPELETLESDDVTYGSDQHSTESERIEYQKFRLAVDIFSPESTAKEIARSIQQAHGNSHWVSNIRLSRLND